jgi:hypothetical protein
MRHRKGEGSEWCDAAAARRSRASQRCVGEQVERQPQDLRAATASKTVPRDSIFLNSFTGETGAPTLIKTPSCGGAVTKSTRRRPAPAARRRRRGRAAACGRGKSVIPVLHSRRRHCGVSHTVCQRFVQVSS